MLSPNMETGKAWFYMTGQGDQVQNHGPFTVDTMKGVNMQVDMSHGAAWMAILAQVVAVAVCCKAMACMQ